MTKEEAQKILKLWMVSGRNLDGHRGYIEGWFDKDDVKAFSMAIEALSADRPTGEWIDADGNKVGLDADGHPLDSCWCSNCGKWLVASDEYGVLGKFCPNCGAKIQKGENCECK